MTGTALTDLPPQARWNCRAILNDVGWIHENGAALNASGNFPEEFLVYDPMHLRKADMNLLQKEFEAEDDPSDPQSRGVSTYKSLRVDVGAA